MEPNLTRVESPGGKPGHAPGKSITALLERNFGSNTQSTPEDKNAICTLRRAHTVAQGKNVGEKSKVGSKTARERIATSFLRVKDSHELLRKRSSKRLDTPASPRDTPAAAREANHFTVGNVGQNGKIFLRNLVRSPLLRLSANLKATTSTRADSTAMEWTNLLGGPTRSSRSCARNSYLKKRATTGSTFRAGANGEFRIFIDRSDDRPKSADGSLRPTLGTSIPHYGWDFSHYGTDGSTPLYNSIYSRASLSDNCLAARFLRESLNTGPISDVYLSQPDRPSFAASMFSGTPAIELTRGSTATDKPILYELKEPIEPSIFENLVPEMDDDRVVRYVPRTKDISAATPARIVAQISSESFMDYELVSDFFLTFRSYLSASSLLALLLARLQWAINRLQDDGRIIRIRTFAALRHWILNYFVDDFIPDYDLRVRFCETINRMYDSVKAREGGGTSDLKILIDLKRCWYGRCSSYWDFQDQHIAYHTPDYLIVPGGDEQLATGCAESHLKMVRTTSGQDREGRPRPPHVRNDSSATAKSMPVSADSDRSIHATSCSLPPKSPKRLSMSVMDTKGPHLVALAPLKPVDSLQDPPTSSPVASRRFPFHSHAHKRSGSFSDSARDGRAPLSLLKLDSQGHLSTADTLNLGALIRGELYAPAESYMTMMAPPSPPLPFSSGTDRQSQPEETSKPAISSSGVKTIIGSIRRALNSRNGGQGTSTRNTHGHFAPSTRGKTSAMPTNVAFGSDYYRDRKAATAAKKPTRIDILCDRSLQEYHRALTGYVDAKDDDPVQEAGTLRSKRSWVGPGVDVDELDHPALRPDQGRTKSVLTGGSKSIVIVDDTGFRNPLMSGADLRRSFEAAIAQFAQIPDDDDGGVESALMKLEGKWTGGPTDTAAEPQKNHQAQRSAREQEFYHTPHVRTGWDAGVHRRQTLASESSAYSHFRGRSVPRRPYSESLAESEDSYSSIPLLERGLSDESMKKPSQSRTNSHQAAPGRVQPSDASSKYTWYTESSHPSFDIVKETESIKRIPRGSTFPAPHGFSRRLSGLSENSANLLDSQEAADQRLSFYTDSMGRSSLGIPRHPLAHPPTPPMTIQHRSVTSCASPLNPALFQAPPLTPDPSPSRNIESAHVRAIDTQHVSGDVLSRSEWGRQYQDLEPDHVPFILSCESRNLAQQLTIIEMAALSEIDWKDLVDMRWSSGSPSSVSWVEFLMEEERRGIDLVVGRFNLMVKWILSEIVLTRDIHERARTIAKFIHTAAHARRMCNYATMLQIAIALSSTDCSRLQQTWALVSSEDRGLLKDMEVLIQPVRNFHDLRVEMETANVQGGCIPFVGLYVHDLTYNSQKPAQVAAHDGEPLINFERYRTTAKIVKSLLRLIDASTKYTFAPVQGIIERCLWIASLSEEEIQTHSKRLE
ncbi:hypothetical protein APSETT445_002115 [Aspergillus pseudonomiae]